MANILGGAAFAVVLDALFFGMFLFALACGECSETDTLSEMAAPVFSGALVVDVLVGIIWGAIALLIPVLKLELFIPIGFFNILAATAIFMGFRRFVRNKEYPPRLEGSVLDTINFFWVTTWLPWALIAAVVVVLGGVSYLPELLMF